MNFIDHIKEKAQMINSIREEGKEMCQDRDVTLVKVKIPADLSSTGKDKWRHISIDSCIAPIVDALQKGGIDMRGSCCGHEKTFGEIHLQDDRVIIILPSYSKLDRHRDKMHELFLSMFSDKSEFKS